MLLVSDLRLIECSYSIFSGPVAVLVVAVLSRGVVVELFSLELLPATTGAPVGAAGVSVAELLVPESSTTYCPRLLRPGRLLQRNISARKVYVYIMMPPYFPWTVLCMFE
jgi:hypothetical protein